MAASKKNTRHDFLKDGFDLPRVEEKVLEFWKTNGIFEKSVAPERARNKKRFVFYEGPPYANGKPGIHHVLARIFKDIILRYKTMRGYYVPRKAGWDTHGLPVEIAAEKALGLKSKADIEKFGIQRFNEEAKKAVWTYKDEWEKLTQRIGYWLDLKNAYVTYSADYIETIWWTLSQIAKKKLLYKAHKVVPWCSRCGTALSSHELAQGYQEVEDNSVYIKFKLKTDNSPLAKKLGKNAYVLSWTTTPWTLPGNVALAVGEKIKYAIVRPRGSDEAYILAGELVPAVMKDIVHDHAGYVLGKELVGFAYEPLFKIPALQNDNAHKLYAADFVTTTDGTGVVHTAVMYGEDDYVLGVKVGLPQHHTVTEEGKFKSEVPGGLDGLPVKDPETEKKIFAYLEKNKNLLKTEKYVHEYPYCWRCGTPVLYYARDSWFIAMSKLRSQLLKNNKSVHWVPDHVKEGRFGEWLREVKDWNLSRERYWGAPLPIWECKKCEMHEVVGSLEELSDRAGGSKNRYWTMRHGESEAMLHGGHLIDSGQKPFHLTTLGRDQVRQSATKLKKEKIDLIVASDILRTKETAEIVAEVVGAKQVTYDKRLREIHLGALAGCHDERYHALYPTFASKFEERPENGESLRDLRKRLWEFFDEVERKHHGKRILIVSHEYPIWMMFHTAAAWTEQQAIAKKERMDKDFVKVAEVREVPLLSVPRNQVGEVDLHRPFVDEITFACKKCDGEMRRVKEVADVWYDSGSVPFAQQHYPFEDNDAIDKGKAFPADYISEATDQTRGWFYSMMAIATALGYPSPYKNVVCLGLINDKFGQKMSKSKGNIVEPFSIIDKYGVDAVRWYFFSSSPPGDARNFDEQEVAKAFRRMHLIVYNSLVFWQTYADQSAKSKAQTAKSKNVLDKWILAKLQETIDSVTKSFEAYEVREAALALETLVDDLSRWFIRRSRRRLQKPESPADYKAASVTLGYVLLELMKLLAPFTPFFSEALYKHLGPKESVHLDAWPKIGKEQRAKSKELIVAMAEARHIASLSLAKRAELGIKVRQPLTSLTVRNERSVIRKQKELLEILRDEVNVKHIAFSSKISSEIEFDTRITPELKTEGILRELVRTVQELRQEADLRPKDQIALLIEASNISALVVENEKFLKTEINAKMIEYKRGKFTSEITTKLDGENTWIAVRKL